MDLRGRTISEDVDFWPDGGLTYLPVTPNDK